MYGVFVRYGHLTQESIAVFLCRCISQNVTCLSPTSAVFGQESVPFCRSYGNKVEKLLISARVIAELIA